MARKVKLVTFDNDLKATVKKYPVSDSGDRIKVKSGGEGHFMPSFDKDSFLEMPKRFLFFNVGIERVYFARKLSKECVNFSTGVVAGPDYESVKEAAGSTMLKDLGKTKQETSVKDLIIIGLLAFLTLLQLGVIG